MPTVTLTHKAPDNDQSGLLINLREPAEVPVETSGTLVPVSLADVYRRHGNQWLQLFTSEIGSQNAVNASISWWAYTSTAKNLLSSPLGPRLFEALAVIKIIEGMNFDHLYVVGATAGQRAMIRLGTAEISGSIELREEGSRLEFSRLEVGLRLIWQTIHVGCSLIRWQRKFKIPEPDVIALTYVDRNIEEKTDPFFGELHQLMGKRSPPIRLNYLAFIQSPYKTVFPRLLSFGKQRYLPLFLHASYADLLGALRDSWSALSPPQTGIANLRIAPGAIELLLEALRWDVAKGGYLHNLLVYRALRRFARRHTPNRFIYPFENKSLEKLLLLALREAHPDCRIIGYQHTSVTPRHVTFQLSKEEAAVTPMPDLIVTVGEVTRRYLERHGNYPQNIFVTGCALRQVRNDPVVTQSLEQDKTRILLALSSSRFELVAAVEFIRAVSNLCAELEIGVRPHPEFPLSMLPSHLRDWLGEYAHDFSGAPLSDNLNWCTVTAYASSTVALECLLISKPVINLDLGEIVIPDPVIDPPPLWRRARNPAQFLEALENNNVIQPCERASNLRHTQEYMQSYFGPITPTAIDAFLA